MTRQRRRMTVPTFRPDATVLFGLAVFVVLLIINLVVNPSSFDPVNLPSTIGFAAPIILCAFAATPSLLMGNGGIDLSIGPIMGLVNVVVVYQFATQWGVTSAGVLIPLALGLGALVGLVNGLIVAFVRIQPIVVTLGTYLVCAGLSPIIAPTPGGTIPDWLATLAGPLSIVPIVVAGLLWWGFRQMPLYEHLMAYGGDERAVFTTGISVPLVRISAFTIGGIFAGIAGLSLSAVLGSADPTVGTNYSLLGIASAALGGVSMAGGRGGMVRALVGALTIFLLQNLLTFLGVSTFLLQIAYGAVLVLAIAVNGQISELVKKVASR
ncbi:ABC transporter permease [Glaciihabitans sp. UYNi722]|uniref:ABC transporter permease n=1 Tax=Glaciihabitans sp. UYNi722 TaxID=3156344 RepID=UPI0033985276